MLASPKVKIRFPEVYQPLDDAYRYKVVYGGRAGARSWSFARKLLIRGTQKPLLILCTRELQKSIKDSVHRLLRNQIGMLGLGGFYTWTDTAVKGVNGTEFIFLGVKHNADEIKSLEGVDICWIEEAHALTEDSWDIIDPTIRKEGSEIWISYNTRFKFDTIHKMFVVDVPPPNSLVMKTGYEHNPFMTDVLINQMENMKEKDYEKYLNIWGGDLKQLATGAVFGKQITEVKKAGRLLNIPVQKACEVHTFNDIGKNDPCAWWFMQQVGKEFRFIDYYQNRLEDVDHYVRVVKALAYNYGKHWMPHDTSHNRLGMVRNVKQQFEDGGVRPIEIVDRVTDKANAIQLGREAMGNCWFHRSDEIGPIESRDGYIPWLEDGWKTRAQRMERGFDAICNYRYKYSDADDTFQQKPHHDWASNGADAFLQFAQGYREAVPEQEIEEQPRARGYFR
jgi:phage terminase large subunit